jgi:cystathionine beta-lyase/cystathionine gamma-synthase
MKRRPGIATLAVHPPSVPQGRTEPASPPINLSSAYFVPDLDTLQELHHGKVPGGYYRRYGHSNSRQLEGAVAALEAPDAGSWEAVAFSSGMTAAVALFWALLPAGSHVVCGREIYGGTWSFLSNYASRLGLAVTFVDSTPEAVRAAVGRETRAVVVETISNPLMRVPDVPAIVRAAGRVPVFVDNTFATPVLARPLEWGARAVWHSATKYLGGHADALGGVVVAPQADAARLRSLATATGGSISPIDAWLVVRGLRTLEVRFRRACDNALEVASWLERQRAVKGVNYPGLKSSPDRSRARRLFDGGFGAMLSFELRGGLAGAKKFVRALERIKLLPSLGDVQTTISHPARSSHAYLGPSERAAAGVTDGLIRVSTGIEDVQDILADLGQAFQRSQR